MWHLKCSARDLRGIARMRYDMGKVAAGKGIRTPLMLGELGDRWQDPWKAHSSSHLERRQVLRVVNFTDTFRRQR